MAALSNERASAEALARLHLKVSDRLERETLAVFAYRRAIAEEPARLDAAHGHEPMAMTQL